MVFSERRSGCGIVTLGIWSGSLLSFGVWLVVGAITQDWRDATRAASIVALVLFGIAIVGLLINYGIAAAVCVGLLLEAFPTAMYHWSVGNAHGFAWLWIIFWMFVASIAIGGMNRLRQSD